MYRKVLLPLDGSRESGRVLDMVERDLARDGELILLHVIPCGRSGVIPSLSHKWEVVNRTALGR